MVWCKGEGTGLTEDWREGAINRGTGLMTEPTSGSLGSGAPNNECVTAINIVRQVISTISHVLKGRCWWKGAGTRGLQSVLKTLTDGLIDRLKCVCEEKTLHKHPGEKETYCRESESRWRWPLTCSVWSEYWSSEGSSAVIYEWQRVGTNWLWGVRAIKPTWSDIKHSVSKLPHGQRGQHLVKTTVPLAEF